MILQDILYPGDVPYCVLPECLNPILNVCRWIIPDGLGNPVSVRSVIKAYDYIKEHFNNIDFSGCVVYCNSNGGLTASSLVNSYLYSYSGARGIMSFDQYRKKCLGKTGV